jgi:hypothetical protein
VRAGQGGRGILVRPAEELRVLQARQAQADTAAVQRRPHMMDMAEHPDGLDLSAEAALLVVCSTQVRMRASPGCRGAVVALVDAHCLSSTDTMRLPALPRAARQGDGVPPSEARDFCDWLAGPAAPRLGSTHFSVCALGDTCAPRAAPQPAHQGMQRPCPRAHHLPVADPNNRAAEQYAYAARTTARHLPEQRPCLRSRQRAQHRCLSQAGRRARRSYAHFCACGKALDARLEALGGRRLAARADVNREDRRAVDAWAAAVCAALPGLALRPAEGAPPAWPPRRERLMLADCLCAPRGQARGPVAEAAGASGHRSCAACVRGEGLVASLHVAQHRRE